MRGVAAQGFHGTAVEAVSRPASRVPHFRPRFMARVFVLDPSQSRSAFTLRALTAQGHDTRVFREVRPAIFAVAADRPDVLVLLDVPPRLDALDLVEMIKLETGGMSASTIILANEARRREVGTVADLVLPLAANEDLLTNAVNLVLQGRARDEGLVLNRAPAASGAHRAATGSAPVQVRRSDTLPTGRGPASTYVDGYRVVKALGRGGMAMVYLAVHEPTGEERVLKLLPISEHDGGDLVQRLINEAVLLGQVNHPSVARIHEHGFTDWHAYIAMEYLAGGDLRTMLARPVRPDLAVDALVQMAGALEAIHAAGIVHRDLKPENVMIRADGTFVLVDFGIARQAGVQLSYVGTGHVVGTAAYLAPEYLKGGAVDHRGDLYSLGVMFYEMLTGRKPYEGENPVRVLDMHIHAPVPQLPPQFRWAQPLIDRTMAKDPERRYQSAADLIAGVLAAVGALQQSELTATRVA